MDYITVSEFGRIAHLSPDWIRHLIRLGRLVPEARTESGIALFTRDQVGRWEEARRSARTGRGAGA